MSDQTGEAMELTAYIARSAADIAAAVFGGVIKSEPGAREGAFEALDGAFRRMQEALDLEAKAVDAELGNVTGQLEAQRSPAAAPTVSPEPAGL